MSIRPSFTGSCAIAPVAPSASPIAQMNDFIVRLLNRFDQLSGQGSPVVKALPVYWAGVIDFVVQHLAWVQNPVVVARQLLAGISNGMLLFLISAGLSLIFGVLRIINFAHGAFFMIGAFIAVSASGLAPGGIGGFAAALLGAAAGLALLGVALETGLLRRIYRAPHEYQLLLTFALVFILGDVAKVIWGREDNSVAVPAPLTGSAQAFGLTFPTYRLFLIVTGIAVAAGLWFVLHRTRWGVFVRAATM